MNGVRRKFSITRGPARIPTFLGAVGRGTERDTLLDGGYEADGVARGESRKFKGLSSVGELSALRVNIIYKLDIRS